MPPKWLIHSQSTTHSPSSSDKLGPLRSTVKNMFPFIIKQSPQVAVIIIIMAKEEVRWYKVQKVCTQRKWISWTFTQETTVCVHNVTCMRTSFKWSSYVKTNHKMFLNLTSDHTNTWRWYAFRQSCCTGSIFSLLGLRVCLNSSPYVDLQTFVDNSNSVLNY